MLVAYNSLNPEQISPFRMGRESFDALRLGNLTLLANSSDRLPEAYEGTVADLLLATPSTAIMHFEEPQSDLPARGVMLAVNYHLGHSEGQHKIVVQNPAERAEGQAELWVPPGSGNKLFYQRMSDPRSPYQFEPKPTNPDKIKNYYVHIGEPNAASVDFKAAGFEFSDEPIYGEGIFDLQSPYYRLSGFSAVAENVWDPFS